MSVAENITLMRRWYHDVWNEGRTQTIHDLLDKDVFIMGPGNPPLEMHGLGGFEKFYGEIRKAFGKHHIQIEDIFGYEDKVVIRWSDETVHTGEFRGIAATNRTVRVTGISIAEIHKGKVIRGWDNWDQLALMEQISAQAAAAE